MIEDGSNSLLSYFSLQPLPCQDIRHGALRPRALDFMALTAITAQLRYTNPMSFSIGIDVLLTALKNE